VRAAPQDQSCSDVLRQRAAWDGLVVPPAAPSHEPVRLRRATSADADAVTDVFLRSMFTAMPWLARPHTDEETRAWVEHVVIAEQQVWVAERDGRVLGFAALRDGWLEHLYLAPEAQRRGIGGTLLALIRQHSPEGLSLYAFARNVAARRFYERNGFVAVATSDGAGNEQREPDVTYRWEPPG
jgi:ribosomal protein S18 acetylase RimI-like enzyme